MRTIRRIRCGWATPTRRRRPASHDKEDVMILIRETVPPTFVTMLLPLGWRCVCFGARLMRNERRAQRKKDYLSKRAHHVLVNACTHTSTECQGRVVVVVPQCESCARTRRNIIQYAQTVFTLALVPRVRSSLLAAHVSKRGRRAQKICNWPSAHNTHAIRAEPPVGTYSLFFCRPAR